MRKYSSRTGETSFEKQVYDLLKKQTFIGDVRRSDHKIKRLQRYAATSHLPDICGHTTSGRAFYIELKVKGNKASEGQIEFIMKARSNNCIAFVAYSIEEIKLNFAAENLHLIL